ncbi:MAG: AAA family ATPase [Prevotellaceae bacterium]|jgi:exonuclease SbcC|nr:AAA family ATPase [Prevotellaceae bacterium]
MKILAIRGKNLASLEKEFEVDFTAEPLRSAGIFVITGPTGSGKSTLLDALCLALFDASPRTNRASENIQVHDVGDKTINQRDSRNILRRGATEGHAEVEFASLGGETFRSRWSVRRARSKADGSMQSSEIRLYNLSAEKEEPGLKTELLAKISGLIGLSFDQFTRSVLLAQGDFATFLKARQSEKAELLEKLTGTDIYSRISVAIYEKTKAAEAGWNLVNERIKGTELLPEEQIIALESEKTAVQQELATLKKECEILNAQLKWIDNRERLDKDVKQAEADFMAAQKTMEDAGKRFEYISQSESVQDIRDTFGLLNNTRTQLAGYKKNLLTTEKQREENAKRLSDAQTVLLNCEKEQETLLEKQKEITPQILKARELDVRIKAANVNTDDAQKEFDAARTAFEKTEKQLFEVKNALKRAEKTFFTLNQWFAANKSYENIAPRTELLINLATDAQTAHEQKEQNRKTLASNQTLLEENLKQSEAMKQEAERLNRLLPAEIIALKVRLTEGEPCPVCGSTHHPATRTEGLQRMKEQELQKAKDDNTKQSELLVNEIENRKNEIARLSAMIENYTIQYDKAYRNLENNLSELPDWKDLFERTELKEYLRTRTHQWNSNTEEFTKAQENINKLHTTIENEENKRKETAENLKAKTERLADFRNTAEQLKAERTHVLHGKPADTAEKYFTDQQQIITNKLKKATDDKNNLIARQESLNGIISQIQAGITQSDEKCNTMQKEVDKWIEEKGNITYKQLTELFEKDNTWIQAEKQALQSLTEAETTAKATYAERRKNLEMHNDLPAKPDNETDTKALLQEKLTEKTGRTENRNKRMTEIEVSLSSNAKAKEQIKRLEKELKEKGALAENWKKLNTLLGSANGSKFKEIAQGYTLETLLSYANKHLQELSPRYQLQRIPGTLALQVVDTDMLNEVRTIHSLSGGESFLISLALALGLSSLSSNRMKVESLFIDEGFGSLDSDTLRIAMDALGQLQTQGRKIGVISHVTEMTERIAVRIKVTKTSNGKSEIEVIG